VLDARPPSPTVQAPAAAEGQRAHRLGTPCTDVVTVQARSASAAPAAAEPSPAGNGWLWLVLVAAAGAAAGVLAPLTW